MIVCVTFGVLLSDLRSLTADLRFQLFRISEFQLLFEVLVFVRSILSEEGNYVDVNDFSLDAGGGVYLPVRSRRAEKIMQVPVSKSRNSFQLSECQRFSFCIG